MSHFTPSHTPNGQEEDMDTSEDQSMDLDTPLPRRGGARRAAATGVRTRQVVPGSSARMQPPAPAAVLGRIPVAPTRGSRGRAGEGSGVDSSAPASTSRPNATHTFGDPSNESASKNNLEANQTRTSLVPSLQSLRQQAQHALSQNSPASAIFFADALVTLSKSHPDDVYLLALAYSRGGEYRRAVQLLRRTGMLSLSKAPMAGVPYAAASDARDPGSASMRHMRATIDIRALLLAGQCLAASKLWKECLEVVHPGGMHPNNGAGAGFVEMEDDDEAGNQSLGSGTGDYNYFNDDETAQAMRLERSLRKLSKRGAVVCENGNVSVTGGEASETTENRASDNSSSPRIIFRGIGTVGSTASNIGGLGMRDEGAAAAAAMYLLRGRAYEEVGNRERAIEWYKAALRADVACVEAFSRLIDNRMLTSKEEQELLPNLPWSYSAQDQWLLLVYESKILTYQCKVEPDGDDGNGSSVGGGGFGNTGGSLTGRANSNQGAANAVGIASTPMSHTENVDQSSAPKTPILPGFGGGSSTSGRSLKKRFEQVEGPCGMRDNMDVVVSKAECCLLEHNPRRAYELSKWVHEKDPFNLRCASVHVAALVELGHKSELFYMAHNLVAAYPERAIAWFSVGCYYYVTGQFERARRYFHKATTKEPQYAPAWIGFGNSYAAQDESDQAMAAYRTAMRLFPGSHLPYICTGMEYLRTNNFQLAEQYFRSAQQMCPNDPLVYNEIGVVYFKQGDWPQAECYFKEVMRLVSHLPHPLLVSWEATRCNLGHVCRKMEKLDEAAAHYELALGLCPRRASTYTALGFTRHIQGNFDAAVEHYHQALGIRPTDTFASEMLRRALEDALETSDWIASVP